MLTPQCSFSLSCIFGAFDYTRHETQNVHLLCECNGALVYKRSPIHHTRLLSILALHCSFVDGMVLSLISRLLLIVVIKSAPLKASNSRVWLVWLCPQNRPIAYKCGTCGNSCYFNSCVFCHTLMELGDEHERRLSCLGLEHLQQALTAPWAKCSMRQGESRRLCIYCWLI